jgi:molybdopterin/thiamine biosynthesis adenylyltransferase
MLLHEQLYRSAETMRRLRSVRVTICGAGALGANIAESLARSGCGTLRVIDRDRIEERNLSTQPWVRADIGAFKAKILANMIYRAVGVGVEGITKEVTSDNVDHLLNGSDLVIDLFDNSLSRQIIAGHCIAAGIPCLHVGLANGYAEIIWNEEYRVPSAAQDDICDYPLARNLVMLTTAVACEVIVGFVSGNEKRNYTITLDDFVVQEYTHTPSLRIEA